MPYNILTTTRKTVKQVSQKIKNRTNISSSHHPTSDYLPNESVCAYSLSCV